MDTTILAKYGIPSGMDANTITAIVTKREELIGSIVSEKKETSADFRKVLDEWKNEDASEKVASVFENLQDLVWELVDEDPKQLAVLYEGVKQFTSFLIETRDDEIRAHLSASGIEDTSATSVNVDEVKADATALKLVANSLFATLTAFGMPTGEWADKTKTVTKAGQGKVTELVMKDLPKGKVAGGGKKSDGKGYKAKRAAYFLNDNPAPMRLSKVCDLINRERKGQEKFSMPKVLELAGKEFGSAMQDWELEVADGFVIRCEVKDS